MKAADKKAKEAAKRSGELQEELTAEKAKTAAAEKELKDLKALVNQNASAMQMLLQAAAPQAQPQPQQS